MVSFAATTTLLAVRLAGLAILALGLAALTLRLAALAHVVAASVTATVHLIFYS